jgi:hypothetical protein
MTPTKICDMVSHIMIIIMCFIESLHEIIVPQACELTIQIAMNLKLS